MFSIKEITINFHDILDLLIAAEDYSRGFIINELTEILREHVNKDTKEEFINMYKYNPNLNEEDVAEIKRRFDAIFGELG